MAISFVNGSSAAAASYTVDVTPPTGIADNDILVAACYHNSASQAVTWPAGFTDWGGSIVNTYHNLRVAWKRAASESGNYTIVQGSHWADQIIGMVLAFRGCKVSGDPANVSISNTIYQVSDTIVRAATITPTAGVALVWLAMGVGYWPGITSPSGFTDANQCGYSDTAYLDGAYKLSQAAGATGSVDGSIAGMESNKRHAIMIALDPVGTASFIPGIMRTQIIGLTGGISCG